MPAKKTKKNKKEGKKEVPEKKEAALAKLVELLAKSPTVMIVSIEGMPSFNFQQIKQELKKQKATVTVVKKSLMLRALEQIKKERPEITSFEKWIEKPFAIISSKFDPFELASLLADYRLPSKAKSGQISPKDIEIEAGPTDLPAGPAISELSAADLKVGIEGGKIVIKESKTLVHKDEAIPANIAAILSKLEIVPFQIGLEPLIAYDSKNNKVYEEIKIDKEAVTNQLKEFAMQASALSLYIDYPTSGTIVFLIAKANQNLNTLSGLIK